MRTDKEKEADTLVAPRDEVVEPTASTGSLFEEVVEQEEKAAAKAPATRATEVRRQCRAT